MRRTLVRNWRPSRDDWEVATFVLSVKVLLFLSVCASYVIHKDKWIRTSPQLLEMFGHWDAGQYTKIATIGYGSAGEGRLRLAFFPLYPWLMKLLGILIPNALVSGLIISNLASVALGIMFWKLVAMDFADDAAHRAVWFLFVFPTSYFLDLPYTESLFLAPVIGSFLFSRRKNWAFAGILGALASLTHDTGPLLLLVLGIEALSDFRASKRFDPQWLWLSLIPAGFGVFLLVNYSATGNPLTFLSVEASHWGNRFAYPWMILHQAGVVTWMNPASGETMGLQTTVFVVIGLAAAIAAIWMLRPSYWVWMAANWLIIASQTWDISAPRLVLTLFQCL